MSDAELIQMLRQRLATVEGAAMDLIDVFERTGNERKAAWEFMRAITTTVEIPLSVSRFLNAYERTMPERLAASVAFQEALTTDLETALLSDPNVTPEQIAEWVK